MADIAARALSAWWPATGVDARPAWPRRFGRSDALGWSRSKLGVRDRLPTPQPLCDQLRASSIVVSVQDDYVLWIDAPVNTGRPRVRAGVRTSREVPGRAIGGLQQDFSHPVQLRCVRVPGPFSLPIVENARRLLPILHRFAPVSR